MSDVSRPFGDRPVDVWGELPRVAHDENDGFFESLVGGGSSPASEPETKSEPVPEAETESAVGRGLGGPPFGRREELRGPRLVVRAALSDRPNGSGRDPGRRLTEAERAFVSDLVWLGPISDGVLGRIRSVAGGVASSRTAIRNLVRNPRRHGLVDGYDWSVGGAKARFATAEARDGVGAELEAVEEWTRVEISRHVCRLDAAAFVLPDCVRVVSGRQIRSWPGFSDGDEVYGRLGVRVDVSGVGVQAWVPDLWAQQAGSMAGVAVFVLDEPVPAMVLRPVVRAVAGLPGFCKVVFVSLDPEIVSAVSAAVDAVGAGRVCEVRLVSLTTVRLEERRDHVG